MPAGASPSPNTNPNPNPNPNTNPNPNLNPGPNPNPNPGPNPNPNPNQVCQLELPGEGVQGASVVVDMHGVAIPNFFLLNILQVECEK